MSVFVLNSFSPFHVLYSESDSKAESISTDPPLFPPQTMSESSPLKPGIAVVVGVLIFVSSVTLLMLLYAKHCKRRNSGGGGGVGGFRHRLDGGGFGATRNSGIDRAVIESLPVFRFGALSGDKDGLECAVCLARFEPTEVLRLLPKCNHAFHVECVDTWLDAHSTCPLCRYRVDPEDILLIGDCTVWHENPCAYPQQKKENPGLVNQPDPNLPDPGYRRVTGRHSSAGEGTSHELLRRPGESNTTESDRSRYPTSFRRSLDSSLRKKRETVTVGCFDRAQRRDGQLLPEVTITDRKSFERRFKHRIVISAGARESQSGVAIRDHRWSDIRPSDLLYLRSEMILRDSHGRRPPLAEGVINGRSASEITTVGRFPIREIGGTNDNSNRNNGQRHDRERQAAGVVSRWLDWVSSLSQPGARSHSHCPTVASLA